MAHRTLRSGYSSLVNRLNAFPQGAPDSPLLRQILGVLMTEEEAKCLSVLPIQGVTAQKAAELWGTDYKTARNRLESLAERAVLLDLTAPSADEEANKKLPTEPVFFLPPPMAGFFEFSLMRTRGDIDQKLLAQLYYEYLNVEEDFIKALFTSMRTQPGRAFVNEEALEAFLAKTAEAFLAKNAEKARQAPGEDRLLVLDYERASEVMRQASDRAIGMCYCRHKMSHVGQACGAPMDICMAFGGTASSLIKHGHARRVDVAEGLDLLQEARDHGLVQFGENVREGVSFICNCCGCCCEALIAARRMSFLQPVETTNYLAEVRAAGCTGCGKCVAACPVEALGLVSANDAKSPNRRIGRVDPERCLGCGVCVAACKQDSLVLIPRQKRVLTPLNSAHRVVLMAIERGKLQNLVFESQTSFGHRAGAVVLGAILRLDPVKRALASEQVGSRYLETVIRWMGV